MSYSSTGLSGAIDSGDRDLSKVECPDEPFTFKGITLKKVHGYCLLILSPAAQEMYRGVTARHWHAFEPIKSNVKLGSTVAPSAYWLTKIAAAGTKTLESVMDAHIAAGDGLVIVDSKSDQGLKSFLVPTRDVVLASALVQGSGPGPEQTAAAFVFSEPSKGWTTGSSSAAVGGDNMMLVAGIGVASVLGYMVYKSYGTRERNYPE